MIVRLLIIRQTTTTTRYYFVDVLRLVKQITIEIIENKSDSNYKKKMFF